MTESINVSNSFIAFPSSIDHEMGQKVIAKNDVGYIIGVKLGRFGWDYLVLIGNPPTDDSEQNWYHNYQLQPYNN